MKRRQKKTVGTWKNLKIFGLENRQNMSAVLTVLPVIYFYEICPEIIELTLAFEEMEKEKPSEGPGGGWGGGRDSGDSLSVWFHILLPPSYG